MSKKDEQNWRLVIIDHNGVEWDCHSGILDLDLTKEKNRKEVIQSVEETVSQMLMSFVVGGD